MLKEWQEKYPKIFAAYPNLTHKLSAEKQTMLDSLLNHISQKHLLTDTIINRLLVDTSVVKERLYLIEKLIELKYFSQSSLEHLLNHEDLGSLYLAVSAMDRNSLLSVGIVQLLLATSAPQACTQFISQALHAKSDLNAIITFLSGPIKTADLSRSFTLFDYSSFTYTPEHFNAFALITTVLANPLCRVIFDARLRAFSDYALPTEPLKNSNYADQIIGKVCSLNHLEEQIAAFFDFFCAFRPFPDSQKYLVEINMEEQVIQTLNGYLEPIDTLNTKEDFLRIKQLINKIKTKKGASQLFDDFKYDMASAIESDDMCSTRRYSDHMDALWTILDSEEVQQQLEKYQQELTSSKGYKEMMTTNMQGNALLMSSSTRVNGSEMGEQSVASPK
ncbi:MAG: hypothetical protein PSV35_03870 [bacterium]|nr:hypothetical protein [bacterium]